MARVDGRSRNVHEHSRQVHVFIALHACYVGSNYKLLHSKPGPSSYAFSKQQTDEGSVQKETCVAWVASSLLPVYLRPAGALRSQGNTPS